MISSVVPEFIGGGVEKCKGNCASFWLLDSVLASSTHPVVFEVRTWLCGQLLFSSPRNLWYWSQPGGISDSISFYYYFSFPARQFPPVSKMPFFCGCDPGAPLPVSTKPASCSGAHQIPNRLLSCPEMGCHLLPDWDVQIQLGAFSELPVLWSYWQWCLRVAHCLLLLKLVPKAAACLGCSGCGADSCPQSWLWGMNPAVQCLIKMPGWGWPTAFNNNIIYWQ